MFNDTAYGQEVTHADVQTGFLQCQNFLSSPPKGPELKHSPWRTHKRVCVWLASAEGVWSSSLWPYYYNDTFIRPSITFSYDLYAAIKRRITCSNTAQSHINQKTDLTQFCKGCPWLPVSWYIRRDQGCFYMVGEKKTSEMWRDRESALGIFLSFCMSSLSSESSAIWACRSHPPKASPPRLPSASDWGDVA